MGLDFKKLSNLSKELTDRNKDNGLVYASKMNGEMDIRILPPPAELNGVYYYEQVVYFIGGKSYLDNSTFGEDSVIEEEIELALAENDPDLKALLDNEDLFKRSCQWLIPILHLDCAFNEENVCESIKIVDDKGKLLVVGPTLLKEINAVVTSRFVGKDITDRKNGFNILLSKTGVKFDTKYRAEAWREKYELPEKYYSEQMIPNPVTFSESKKLSDEYLRGVVKNYLYGEPMPNLDIKYANKSKTTAPAKPAAGRSQASTSSRSTATPSGRGQATPPVSSRTNSQNVFQKKLAKQEAPQEEETHDEEAEQQQEAPQEKAPRKGRNLLTDLENV